MPRNMLVVGERIRYLGDMANEEGWFKVAAIGTNDDGDRSVYKLEEEGGNRHFFLRSAEVDHDFRRGFSTRRFVSEVAFLRYREERIQAFRKAEEQRQAAQRGEL